jgi:hypothetical protein
VFEESVTLNAYRSAVQRIAEVATISKNRLIALNQSPGTVRPPSILLYSPGSIADLVTYEVDMPDRFPVQKEGSSVGLLPSWKLDKIDVAGFGTFGCHSRRWITASKKIARTSVNSVDPIDQQHVRREHVLRTAARLGRDCNIDPHVALVLRPAATPLERSPLGKPAKKVISAFTHHSVMRG